MIEDAFLKDNPGCIELFKDLKFNTTQALGEDNLIIRQGEESFPLYDPDGVSQEAQEWFKSIQSFGAWRLFVFGLGLGAYYTAAKQWLKKNPNAYLVFFESNPEVLARFFKTSIAKEIVGDPQVKIYYINLKEMDFSRLPHFLFAGNIEIDGIKSYKEHYLSDFQNFYQTIKNLSLLSQAEQGELFSLGSSFFLNFYRNLQLIPDCYQASKLFGKFEGIPAIICGAGPSLEKNSALLKTLSDRALIFGGGTAMNVLNAAGIIPHFGAGIDPNLVQSFRIATNNAFMTPYFFRSRLNYEALKILHGDKLYVTGTGGYRIGEWFDKKLGMDSLFIEEGMNVVNFCLSIAIHLGCNPIIFAGLDLSYSEKGSYAPGVIRFPLQGGKEPIATKGPNEELLVHQDIYGKPILTLWKWIKESEFFQRMQMKNQDKIFINATEGGIGMKGIANSTLQHVKDKYLTKQFDLQKKVHEAIENSKMTSTATHETINEALREFLTSLQNASNSLLQRTSNYKDEPAWEYLLEDFDQFYRRYFGEQADQNETGRIDFLLRVCALNMSIIASVLEKPKRESAEAKGGDSDGEKYYYKSGVLRASIPKKQGLIHGMVELYFPSGQIKRRVPFCKGKREGLELWWYESGVIQVDMKWKDNQPFGTALLYYPNGKVKLKVEYDLWGRFLSRTKFSPFDGSPLTSTDEGDFFDKTMNQTTKLHEKLNEALSSLSRFKPVLDNQGQISQDFLALKEDFEELEEINKRLKEAEELESIWKTPQSSRWMGDQMEKSTHEMQEKIKEIQKLLKKFKQ